MGEFKRWYEDWEIITHPMPMNSTVKEILLPNSPIEKKFVVMYGMAQDDIRNLTNTLESALTELGKRAAPKTLEEE